MRVPEREADASSPKVTLLTHMELTAFSLE